MNQVTLEDDNKQFTFSSNTEQIESFSTRPSHRLSTTFLQPTPSAVSDIQSVSQLSARQQIQTNIRNQSSSLAPLAGDSEMIQIEDSEGEGELFPSISERSRNSIQPPSLPSSVSESADTTVYNSAALAPPQLSGTGPTRPLPPLPPQLGRVRSDLPYVYESLPAPFAGSSAAALVYAHLDESNAAAAQKADEKEDREDDTYGMAKRPVKKRSVPEEVARKKADKKAVAAAKKERAAEEKRLKQESREASKLLQQAATGAKGKQKQSSTTSTIISTSKATLSADVTFASSSSLPEIHQVAVNLDHGFPTLSAVAAPFSKSPATRPKNNNRMVVQSDGEDESIPMGCSNVLESPHRIIVETVQAGTASPKELVGRKSKKRGRTMVEDDEAEDGNFSESRLKDLEADDESDESDFAKGKSKSNQVNGAKKGKGKAKLIKHGKSKTSSGLEMEQRARMMMEAAAGPGETSLLAEARNHSSSSLVGQEGTGDGSLEEGGCEDVENVSKTMNETPIQAILNSSKAIQPVKNSNTRLKGLAGVIQRIGLPGARPQGLSSRSKIPRLLTILKSPPPKKPPLPKEKPKPLKKGEEDYSDEEKPWYETKHPEDWDSDDCEKYRKITKRRESGYASD